MILKLKNFTKKFGNNVLFKDVDFIIHEKDKIGLIGQNGTGKSTLIKCISGDEPYEGLVEVDKEIKLSIMEQEKDFDKQNQSFMGYLKNKQEIIKEKIKKCEESFSNQEIYEDQEKFEHLMQEYEKLLARNIEKIEESKIREILNELNFEMEDYQKRIADLSGGQKTKLRLAECLSKESDILILDEPTNHLDFDALEWLENYLLRMKQGILVVSHDRFFLNKIVQKIIEIEDKHLEVYHCNYEKYKQEKKHHLELLWQKFKDNEKERKKLLDSAKEKREWAQVSGSKQLKSLADNLERKAEEIPKVTDPKKLNRKFDFNFIQGKNSGNFVLSALNIEKSFGEINILKNINLVVHRGERIAIQGANGCGKTTLLKIFCNLLPSDKGEINKGININIGYFDQELGDIDKKQRVLDFFLNEFPQYQEHNLISTAIKFGFPYEKMKDRIKNLSGGEKARLNLVRIMLKKCNVLVLDEPTNNLDLVTIENLEESLREYPGTIIFVSHDRYFIDKVADKKIKIENKTIKTLDS